MQSGAGMGGRRRIRGISLTPKDESGLMRPVARIAQSVEQGIENPRVLGSIPSPGTTILKNPPKRRVFAFGEPDSPSNCVRFTRRLPATRPAGSAARCAKTLPAFLSGPGTTYSENPPKRRVFAFGYSDSPSNCVRFTRRLPATRPAGSAAHDISGFLCALSFSHNRWFFLTGKPAFSQATPATAPPSQNHGPFPARPQPARSARLPPVENASRQRAAPCRHPHR